MYLALFCQGIQAGHVANSPRVLSAIGKNTVPEQIKYLSELLPEASAEAAASLASFKAASPQEEQQILDAAPAVVAEGIRALGGVLKLMEAAPKLLAESLEALSSKSTAERATGAGNSPPVANPERSCAIWLLAYLACIGTGPLAAGCGLGMTIGYMQCHGY